ncbi:LysR substrate-binding domain-containing protein [Salinisphaera sp. SPP-AMP-43]|uniref:LysR substrate-binding domain-containing protein n=1 Tax=Salinisphaera sp. SPP-AMP-43 TaxID=3121288 RepID=UPI003C6E00B1
MSRLRRTLPPLASLLPFEAAARRQSFTAAAAELHLTQAAVSRQIRALEQDLGVSLFTRQHRSVALTDAGAELARAIGNGLETIAATAERLRSRRDNDDVVLLTEIYMSMYWLIPRLPAFHDSHPQIRLRVNASTQPLTYAEESFDLALQCGTRPAGVLAPVFSVPDEVFPVCSPAVAAAGSLSAADLADYPILHCRDDPQDGWLTWGEWLSAVGLPGPAPEGSVFDNYPVVLQAAVMGQGIGLGWGRGLEHLLATGQLVRPMPDYLTLPRGLSVYAAPGRADDAHTATVIDWLADTLAANPT